MEFEVSLNRKDFSKLQSFVLMHKQLLKGDENRKGSNSALFATILWFIVFFSLFFYSCRPMKGRLSLD